MGAWGFKSFENDDACDWVYRLEASKDRSVVHKALNLVTSNSDYLESPDCCIALAAAEVVLAGISGQHERVTDDIKTWLNKKQGLFRRSPVTFEITDVELALMACKKILASSELKELWEETDDFSDWQSEVEKIIRLLEEQA